MGNVYATENTLQATASKESELEIIAKGAKREVVITAAVKDEVSPEAVVTYEPCKEKVKYVYIVGRVGAGKSWLGNHLLRRKEFESRCATDARTSDVIEKRSFDGKIAICDTPGIPDTGQNTELYIDKVVNSMKKTGYNLIIFMFSFTPGGRITDKDIETLKAIKKCLNDLEYRSTLLVINNVAEKGTKSRKSQEEAIKEAFFKYSTALDVLGCNIATIPSDSNEDIDLETVKRIHKWIESLSIRSAERFRTLEQLREWYQSLIDDGDRRLKLVEDNNAKIEQLRANINWYKIVCGISASSVSAGLGRAATATSTAIVEFSIIEFLMASPLIGVVGAAVGGIAIIGVTFAAVYKYYCSVTNSIEEKIRTLENENEALGTADGLKRHVEAAKEELRRFYVALSISDE